MFRYKVVISEVDIPLLVIVAQPPRQFLSLLLALGSEFLHIIFIQRLLLLLGIVTESQGPLDPEGIHLLSELDLLLVVELVLYLVDTVLGPPVLHPPLAPFVQETQGHGGTQVALPLFEGHQADTLPVELVLASPAASPDRFICHRL